MNDNHIFDAKREADNWERASRECDRTAARYLLQGWFGDTEGDVLLRTHQIPPFHFVPRGRVLVRLDGAALYLRYEDDGGPIALVPLAYVEHAHITTCGLSIGLAEGWFVVEPRAALTARMGDREPAPMRAAS
jgi:hypothetical protein